jgi:DNA (cytosine-5)-methyltransferase 1
VEKIMSFNAIELCAGGGGQALGLEMAGFHHVAAVEYEPHYCTTLRTNRPHWKVIEDDIRNFRSQDYSEIDLIAGGVPCPPFSIAGKQLGGDDERDMFPAALKIIEKIRPRAVLLENVQGLASAKFKDYRNALLAKLTKFGYQPDWKVLQATDFGVPQLRPRFVLVALMPRDAEFFEWPEPTGPFRSVGETLVDLMGANCWPGAEAWAGKALAIAPTVVGGSKKHGGPDLGPTRAKKQWRELHVDGMGIADEAPDENFPENGVPRLTVRMVARIQGFPDEWEFAGKKTIAYRQVGNAFPPLVAKAVGLAVRRALLRQRVSVNDKAEANQYRLLEKSVQRKNIINGRINSKQANRVN